MMGPRPESLRLHTRSTSAIRPPRPPFGLPGWSPDGAAVAVLLDASGADLEDLAAVAEQIPAAAALPAGTQVVVLGTAAATGGLWRRLLGRRGEPVARPVRCSALVARGYVDVGGGREGSSDLAWGRAPGP
jgi:hypothetical protein